MQIVPIVTAVTSHEFLRGFTHNSSYNAGCILRNRGSFLRCSHQRMSTQTCSPNHSHNRLGSAQMDRRSLAICGCCPRRSSTCCRLESRRGRCSSQCACSWGCRCIQRWDNRSCSHHVEDTPNPQRNRNLSRNLLGRGQVGMGRNDRNDSCSGSLYPCPCLVVGHSFQ